MDHYRASERLADAIAAAVRVLRDGGVIAYPTDTLYALGAHYSNEDALRRIIDLKLRPEEKSLSLIIGTADQLALLTGEITPAARSLMDRFWPGPLTLVFRALPSLSRHITFDDTVAVRIPGSSVALDLARAAGFPITATSANVSGRPPASDAAAVLDYFDGALDLLVDGGSAVIRTPSTIVDVTGQAPRMIRAGAVTVPLQQRS